MNLNNILENEISRYLKNLDYSSTSSDEDEYRDNETPTISFKDGRSVCFRKHKKSNKQYLNKIIYINDKTNKNEKYIDKIESFKYDFFQIPDYKAKRECLYICGPNQSGKSTYISNYLKYFKKIYSEKNKNFKPIYLFSKLNEDPILDIYDPIRVDIEKFKLNNNTLEKMRDSIVIFDDVDQIHNKTISKKIYDSINEILCNGAHYNIHIIVSNHLCSDYKNTRIILNECSSITVFCKSGSKHQIEYTLKNYLGLSKFQINKVFSLPSRWVTNFKHYPQCVLYSRGIYLL